MDQPTAGFAIKVLLSQIRERLEEASSVAKAAEGCAESGNIDQGAKVALDIEQLIYEASRLLDAASLINRLSKEE
jgi:hypothetical protein